MGEYMSYIYYGETNNEPPNWTSVTKYHDTPNQIKNWDTYKKKNIRYWSNKAWFLT